MCIKKSETGCRTNSTKIHTQSTNRKSNRLFQLTIIVKKETNWKTIFNWMVTINNCLYFTSGRHRLEQTNSITIDRKIDVVIALFLNVPVIIVTFIIRFSKNETMPIPSILFVEFQTDLFWTILSLRTKTIIEIIIVLSSKIIFLVNFLPKFQICLAIYNSENLFLKLYNIYDMWWGAYNFLWVLIISINAPLK